MCGTIPYFTMIGIIVIVTKSPARQTTTRISRWHLCSWNWLKRRHLEQKLVKDSDDGASHLWLMSSSLFVSSPGSPRGAAAPPGSLPSAPACTRCPWSPGREGSGCRRCWPLWGSAEGCRRSPGSPSLRCPLGPSHPPPVLSGGFQPGCSDTSCLLRHLRFVFSSAWRVELLNTCLRNE